MIVLHFVVVHPALTIIIPAHVPARLGASIFVVGEPYHVLVRVLRARRIDDLGPRPPVIVRALVEDGAAVALGVDGRPRAGHGCFRYVLLSAAVICCTALRSAETAGGDAVSM